MKIICSTEKLKESLNYSERIITRHLTLPILNNFLIKTEKNGLKIVSTNLEIAVTTWFPCKIIESGEITVPAKIFNSIISGLNSDKVELELKKNNTLNISSGSYRADLKGENAKDFPIIPSLKKEVLVEFNSVDFCKALDFVVNLVSNSETRPEITGIFIFKEKGVNELRIVGTDSFRLGEKIIITGDDYIDTDFSVIVPARTISEVIRIFSNSNEAKINLILDKNRISFESGGKIELVSRLIEGNFPDYQKLIPQNFNTQAVVGRDEFIKTIKLVSLFSSRVNDIMLSFIIKNKESQVKIFASDTDLGENTSELTIEASGEDLNIKFNWKYLIDGFNIIDSARVNLSFIDDIKPCLIKSPQDKTFLYLVMPIRS